MFWPFCLRNNVFPPRLITAFRKESNNIFVTCEGWVFSGFKKCSGLCDMMENSTWCFYSSGVLKNAPRNTPVNKSYTSCQSKRFSVHTGGTQKMGSWLQVLIPTDATCQLCTVEGWGGTCDYLTVRPVYEPYLPPCGLYNDSDISDQSLECKHQQLSVSVV